ncbi:HD domain-containing protein [Clostridium rectalis]|uniref:HD domain-containing protein n=1 Tax=Clostridium rectalis TaxID=2040295 RepID=UPI000F63E964|nr:HD domain-containing protein [Clostridium rectalis]
MKEKFIREIKNGEKISSSFMVMKKLNRGAMYIGDRTGDIKAFVEIGYDILKVGDVICIDGIASENIIDVKSFVITKAFNLEDYLPTVEKPIENILNEIRIISEEEFIDKEIICLNNYFFEDDNFLKEFKRCIGGISQHHNYIGGLAEHTLNVMYLTKVLSYRYNCRYKQLAILAAKLHDMGKIYEYSVEGPFSYSLRGEMEGHIVIGVSMLEEAFNANKELYSEDFKQRMKGCIVQHHGKVAYGSPKQPNTQEAYIVHYADYVDATFNKIDQVKKDVPFDSWSNYDKRLEGKLYI